jgi:hypothetical protein
MKPQPEPVIMSDKIDRLNEAAASLNFARSATRHRISKDSIRHVIANYRLRFEEPPPDGARARSTRIVYLGENSNGRAIEIMAVHGHDGELLVIHAMRMRERYRRRHEEAEDEQVHDS